MSLKYVSRFALANTNIIVIIVITDAKIANKTKIKSPSFSNLSINSLHDKIVNIQRIASNIAYLLPVDLSFDLITPSLAFKFNTNKVNKNISNINIYFKIFILNRYKNI